MMMTEEKFIKKIETELEKCLENLGLDVINIELEQWIRGSNDEYTFRIDCSEVL